MLKLPPRPTRYWAPPAVALAVLLGYSAGWWTLKGPTSFLIGAQPVGGNQSPIDLPAEALIEAINASDPKAIERFAERHVADRFVGADGSKWPRERCVRMLAKLREQSGGLELQHRRHDPDQPHRLTAIFQPRNPHPWLGMELETEAERPDRLKRIDLHLMLPPTPPAAPPTPDGDGRDRNRWSRMLADHIDQAAASGRFSGVVLVSQGDEIVLHRAWGFRDEQRTVPNSPETRFHTASAGKMFTGIAIAQLVESGKLRFESRLSDLLPDYPNRDAANRLTVHHLLTHTSGLADPFFSEDRLPGKAYPEPRDNVALIAEQPLAFEPGSRHAYSNGNYAVLAAIVEALSGQRFGDYVRQSIFQPAGMEAADVSASRRQPWAVGFTHPPETDPLRIEPPRPARPMELGSDGSPLWVGTDGMSGFGGCGLTARDLFRFFRALREHRLLGEAMTQTVVSGKVEVVPGAPVRYAYGFYEQSFGDVVVRGHSGGGGNLGYGSHAEYVWDDDIGVIVLGNIDLEFVRPLTQSLLQTAIASR